MTIDHSQNPLSMNTSHWLSICGLENLTNYRIPNISAHCHTQYLCLNGYQHMFPLILHTKVLKCATYNYQNPTNSTLPGLGN